MKTMRTISLLAALSAGLLATTATAVAADPVDGVIVLKATQVNTETDRKEVTQDSTTTGQPIDVQVSASYRYIIVDLLHGRQTDVTYDRSTKTYQFSEVEDFIYWDFLPLPRKDWYLWYYVDTDAAASTAAGEDTDTDGTADSFWSYQYKEVSEGKGYPMVMRYASLPTKSVTIANVPRLITSNGFYHELYRDDLFDSDGDRVADSTAKGSWLWAWTERLSLDNSFTTQSNTGSVVLDPVTNLFIPCGTAEYGRALVINLLQSLGYKPEKPAT